MSWEAWVLTVVVLVVQPPVYVTLHGGHLAAHFGVGLFHGAQKGAMLLLVFRLAGLL